MLSVAAKRAPVGKMMPTGFAEHPLIDDASESTCERLPIVQQSPSLAVRARVVRRYSILVPSAAPDSLDVERPSWGGTCPCPLGTHRRPVRRPRPQLRAISLLETTWRI